MASVELSLIDTLTFLTNQDIIFQVEQGPFHTQVLVSQYLSNLEKILFHEI
jgi:hypothetical protein